MPVTAPSNSLGAWTAGTLPGLSANWIGTGYGPAGFVTVGYNSTRAAVSSDGITWSSGTLPQTRNWYGVAGGNGIYLAIADGTTTAATSTDGLTWTERTMPSASTWRGPYFANDAFFLRDGTNLIRTTDGVTWSTAAMPVGAGWNAVAYGNGVYASSRAVTGANGCATSTDGVTWTGRTAANAAANLAFGNGIFLGISISGAATNAAQSSTDGITWSVRTMPSSTTWYGIGFANGYFVVANLANSYAITTDGVSWRTGTTAVSGSHNSQMPFGAGKVLSAIQNTTSVDFITVANAGPRPVATAITRAASW